MVKIEKIIFDTNIIRNIEPKTFLGGRETLKQFEKVSELVFPDIVVDELKYQKLRQLEEQKSKFLANTFHWLKGLNENETKEFDNLDYINQLEASEDINYSKIELKDFSILKNIKELALKKQAPFEKGNGTDKGFKDTYIYFTILEYITEIEDEYIFVYTGDGRLKEALDKHSNIKTIKNFEEFKEKSISEFYDSYFLSKLKDELSADINEDDILDYWVNINGNKVVRVHVKNTEIESEYRVEVEQGEIISIVDEIEYVVRADGVDPVKGLINSGSFRNTHFMVAILSEYKNFLSNDEIINILESVPSNSQIIPDEDVQQFINDIYQSKKDIIEKELKNEIEKFLS